MKHSTTKKISIFVCIIMMFTMILGTGSVFANGRDQGPPEPGNFLRIEPAYTYILLEKDQTARLPVIAVYQNRSMSVDPAECEFTVDHPDVAIVQDGYIYTKAGGVATVTIKALGSQTQVTVEVKHPYF
jgi:hypothetical protein